MSERYMAQPRRDETVIDLGDLCQWMVKRLPMIITVGLAGAAAGGAYAFRTDVPVSEASLKAKLTEQEADDVDQIYRMYAAKQQELEQASDYISDSAIMQVNAQAAPEITTAYTITTDIPKVWELYESTALSDADLQKIASALSLESPEYASEMVSFSGYAADSVMSAGESSASVMTVTVYGYSEEDARAVADIVATRVNKVTDELVSSGADVTISSQGSVYTEAYDAGLAARQQKAMSAPADVQGVLQTYRTTYVEKMTADQQAYFNVLDGVVPEESSAAKPVAIGAVLGLLIAIAVYCVEYLCAGVVRTVDDVEQVLGAPIIGHVKPDADAFDLAVPVQEIQTLAARAKDPAVFIQADRFCKPVGNHMVQMMRKTGAKSVASSDALHDAEACKTLLNSGSIIVCVALGHTKVKDLELLTKMLAAAGVSVAGGVAVG